VGGIPLVEGACPVDGLGDADFSTSSVAKRSILSILFDETPTKKFRSEEFQSRHDRDSSLTLSDSF